MRSVTKSFSKRDRLIWILISVFAVLFVIGVGLLFIYGRGYTVQFSHDSYEQAKRFDVIKAFIPPQAKDICYWSVPYRMILVANFKIDEEHFLEWANKKGWHLTTISEANEGQHIPGLCSQANVDPNVHDVYIKSGYVYYEQLSETKEWERRIFAYDKDKGVGYFSQ